jgi:hypothetical protein
VKRWELEGGERRSARVKANRAVPSVFPRALFAALALLWASFSGLGCAATPAPTGPARAEAESAESGEQLLERVLLALLDGEALYTVAGGIKPVSSGYWTTSYSLDAPDLSEIARVQRLLREQVGVDELEFGVMSFAKPHEGKRSAHAWVANRAQLRRVLSERADFFAPLGIGAHQDADEVLAIVERLPRLERFRAYGLLFGYPDYAVEFFVDAAAEEERSGALPAREFAHVATFGAAQHRFVWAVPAGHVENDADRALRTRAERVLERYRVLRERFIGPSRPGAPALLRATSKLRASEAAARS